MNNLKEKKKVEHKCLSCGKYFAYNSSLIKHMRIHTGEKPYKCSIEGCIQRFSQISTLFRHKRIHSGFKPYKCKKCLKKFSSSSNLKQHNTIHTTILNRSKYVCFIKGCNESYFYVCSLRKHMIQTHPGVFDKLQQVLKDKSFYQIYNGIYNKENHYAKFDCLYFTKTINKVFKNKDRNKTKSAVNCQNNVTELKQNKKIFFALSKDASKQEKRLKDINAVANINSNSDQQNQTSLSQSEQIYLSNITSYSEQIKIGNLNKKEQTDQENILSNLHKKEPDERANTCSNNLYLNDETEQVNISQSTSDQLRSTIIDNTSMSNSSNLNGDILPICNLDREINLIEINQNFDEKLQLITNLDILMSHYLTYFNKDIFIDKDSSYYRESRKEFSNLVIPFSQFNFFVNQSINEDKLLYVKNYLSMIAPIGSVWYLPSFNDIINNIVRKINNLQVPKEDIYNLLNM